MAFDRRRFIETFVDEVREHIHKINEGLLSLEKNPDDLETLNMIFYSAHLIKGSSRMLKLNAIAEVAHKLEDALDALREKKILPSKGFFDPFFEGIYAISGMVDKIATGQEITADNSSRVCAVLEKLSEGRVSGGADMKLTPIQTERLTELRKLREEGISNRRGDSMINDKILKQFGLWDSPITPKSLAEGLRFSDVIWDSDGQTLIWREERSDQGILVCAPPDNASKDLTSGLSVRAQVGYGGGDFTVAKGTVYFVECSGRLYRQSLAGGPAVPVTPEFGHAASPCVSPDGRWILFVHTYEHHDVLAMVDAEGRFWPQKLVFGNDFYMQPRWHPDGKRIAWIAWDHPQMPWDGTRLCLARLQVDEGRMPLVTEVEVIAGSENIAIFQPEFSPDGKYLTYLSNETGWSNLYLYDLNQKVHRALTNEPIEIGAPAWVQGLRTYGFSYDGQTLYYTRNEAGIRRLWAYDLKQGRATKVDSPLDDYTWLEQIALSPTRNVLAFIASSSVIPTRIITYDLDGSNSVRIQRRSGAENIPSAELSPPQPMSWKSREDQDLYGLFYAPVNARFQGTGLPPAIILVHGGPTSQSTAIYSPPVQFFTTRGYAVLQVNYRGSTGYGKAYMDALRGNWGIYDVEDSVSGAKHLVDKALADPNKLVIMGGSAGGYTVLQALVNHPGFFKAGVCLYGVSNLFTLAADTHKFEARYLDSLLGPLPEASAIYRERSPLFFADRIQDPIALFQGEVDKVVPKDQSDAIVASLRRRGVPHEYHVYEGEGHGWRKRETIEAFYKAVDAFLRQYVLFA